MQNSGAGSDELARLRREIDAIDDRLHDLLMQRTQLAVAVGAVKAATTPVLGTSPAEGAKFIRPAREARIIRRLIARHRGPLPKAALVRMWREMISALLQVEGPFAVAVHVPSNKPGFWDMARDHYGSRVRLLACPKADKALDAVLKGKATVGVLPYPAKGERSPWWCRLVPGPNTKAESLPHIIACLPFGDSGNQRDPGETALVVGRAAFEATDRDRSLLVLQTRKPVTRAGMRVVQAELGAGANVIGARKGIGRAMSLTLIETGGCYAANDPRLDLLARRLGKDARLVCIGAFAEPLSRAERADNSSEHLSDTQHEARERRKTCA